MNKIIAFLLTPSGLDKREVPNTVEQPKTGAFYLPPKPEFKESPPPPPFEPTLMTLRENNPGAKYPTRQVQQGPFIWETEKGVLIKPKKMATEHLFYALRMLFNHSMPPLARVGDVIRKQYVFEWPVDYKIQAGNAMKDELSKRKDVEPWMTAEMQDMKENAEFVLIALQDSEWQSFHFDNALRAN